MTREFKAYQPILPIETMRLFGHELNKWRWYPYPSRRYWNSDKGGQVEELDNAETVLSIANQNDLQEYLEAIDLTVGCRYPCQTCIRDSQSLSSTMSFETASRIIQNPIFGNLLPKWSACVGFTAEPTDNPNILEIIKLTLAATSDKQNGFRIKLNTNYRKQKEDILSQLMILAGSTNRMTLTVSLPLNRGDQIQDDFSEFKKSNIDLFRKNVNIFDLKNPKWQEIENMGRVLPGAKDASLSEVEIFQTRGIGRLLLNPEGLWFMVNTTKYEAHTPEIYTPVTLENAGLIERKIKMMNPMAGTDFGQAKELKKMAEATQNKFMPRIG
jgi:hypothetical protein